MKINIKLKSIIVCYIYCGFYGVYAQQDPQYTQYMYNHANINPAYAGSVETLNIFSSYRTQWVGLDGAPKTAAISAITSLNDSRMGIGVHFMNDKIGAMTENMIAVDFSYAITLNTEWKLSLGVKTSMNLLDVDYSKLDVYNPSDPVLESNISNKFKPNIGAGLFAYSHNAYVGLSVPQLLVTTRYNDNEVTILKEKMHFYLTGGYVFDMGYYVQFKPALLIKASQGSPVQVDLVTNFLVMEKFTVGASYRYNTSVSGLVGFQVSKNLFIGYSYDAETSKLNNYGSGSHEFFMRFNLFNKIWKTPAPRFF
ncbi:PorP/SprF family type IX secretion system membrane protein [Myroides odoratus]|uniref:Type IX secretion system membrane protein PorP/SprF n=1 Tax=Myroides odoratus TaxID=256 RepID=A0A9Q7ECV7_MYROD|nr:type IX secretion system membrane protein PorP/SprF [Myroides odoratus]QQU02000.1 type IX secretion system membrane protein PorP/SprF [Myroides odoratus]WQD59389.1 type IX secretion system membrane protein PorP/SprF [Myroides odoratus]